MTRRNLIGGVLTASLCLMLLGGTSPSADAVVGEVHLTAMGDIGAGSNSAAALATSAALNPDLTLALGDLSYGTTGAESTWCDFVTSRVGAGFPFELISGNHESNGINGNINDFSACLPNQLPGAVGTYGRQWYVDVPAANPLVRFVMISPNLDYGAGPLSYAAGTAPYTWTAAAIDGARTKSIPWVVVGMHKPCLSMGEYNCDVGADLANLFLTKKVDLVLGGHEHIYQRTKQLGLKQGCTTLVPATFNSSCVVDGDNTLVKGAGTVFVTAGTGGAALRNVNTTDPEAGYFSAWSGLNTDPAYGVLDLKLTADTATARFVPAGTATFTDSFTLGPPGANQSPTAEFTSVSTGLAADLDASASADPDGTIASYAWNFGDGTPAGSGKTLTHTFTAGGTYQVALTVTDNAGATSSVTHPVTVTAPAGSDVATDSFGRSVSNGWGTADLGGAWTLGGTASNFSVSGGQGRVVLTALGTSRTATLGGVSQRDTDFLTTVGLTANPTGGGVTVSGVVRNQSNSHYRAQLSFSSTGGKVTLHIFRRVSGVETLLRSVVVPVTYVPDTMVSLRLRASGSPTTTLSAKAWASTATEPAAWQTTVTDTSAVLQSAGSVGYIAYLSSSAGTTAPQTVLFDSLSVTPSP